MKVTDSLKAMGWAANEKESLPKYSIMEAIAAMEQATGVRISRRTMRAVYETLGISPRVKVSNCKRGGITTDRINSLALYVLRLYETVEAPVPPGLLLLCKNRVKVNGVLSNEVKQEA